ncbi:chitin deacetylase, partial [Dinochytrium kinnereticum]
MRLPIIATAIAASLGSVAAQCSNDPRYPTCNPAQLPTGDWKIPVPPTNEAWTTLIRNNQHPDYPIPDRTPSSGPGPWSAGGASLSGVPWGDPASLNTEVCACGSGMWGLTFDDGPSSVTPGLLDFLRERNVKATFFVIGANVVNEEGNAEILRRAYEEGHQIGYHSWTHHAMTTLTVDQMVSEIVWNAVAIYRVIGRVPRYFRPPYGDVDDRLRNLLLAMNLRPVLWTVISDDASIPDDAPGPNNYTIDAMVDRFQSVIRNGYMDGLAWPPPGAPYLGHVSLHHDLRVSNVEAARRVVPVVIGGGFRGVTVEECDVGRGGAYLGDGEMLLEIVRGVATGVAEPGLTRTVTTTITSTAGPSTTTSLLGDSTADASITSISSALPTHTNHSTTTTTTSPQPMTATGFLALPKPTLAGIFAGIAALVVGAVLLAFLVARKRRAGLAKRDDAENLEPVLGEFLGAPGKGVEPGDTLLLAGAYGEGKCGSDGLVGTLVGSVVGGDGGIIGVVAGSVPRSVRSLGRAVSVRSSGSQYAALGDLVGSETVFSRSRSSVPDVGESASRSLRGGEALIGSRSLGRSMSVRSGRSGEVRTVMRSLGRSMSVKSCRAAADDDLEDVEPLISESNLAASTMVLATPRSLRSVGRDMSVRSTMSHHPSASSAPHNPAPASTLAGTVQSVGVAPGDGLDVVALDGVVMPEGVNSGSSCGGGSDAPYPASTMVSATPRSLRSLGRDMS